MMEDITEMHFAFLAYALNSINRVNSTIPELCEPLCELLESSPSDVVHKTLERIILRLIETHRMLFVLQEGSCCNNHLVHSSLIVATRLAFKGRLTNSSLVARLLGEIYRCDRDMRKILMGAYNEPGRGYGYIHYKSQAEGLQAMEYFLHQMSVAKKMFFSSGTPRRLADLSLDVPNFYHPAVYSISTNRFDTFQLLVRYGADLCDPREPEFKYSVRSRMVRGWGLHCRAKERFRRLFFEVHPELECQVPTLMQLSRKVIRGILHSKFLLPSGIEELPLPPCLKRYVDLEPK